MKAIKEETSFHSEHIDLTAQIEPKFILDKIQQEIANQGLTSSLIYPNEYSAIKAIQAKANCEYFDQLFYGNAALNRKMLLDEDIAQLLTPETLLAIFVMNFENHLDKRLSLQRNGHYKTTIAKAIYFGFIDGTDVIKLMPNNDFDYGLCAYEKQKKDFEINTKLIINNLFKLISILKIDIAYPSAAPNEYANLIEMYNSVVKQIELIKKLNKNDLLLQKIGYTPNEIREQALAGFHLLCSELRINQADAIWTIDSFAEILLSSDKLLLQGKISHLFYDRLHFEACIEQDTEIKIGKTIYFLKDIFFAMVKQIERSGSMIAKEQFQVRLKIILNDLNSRFNSIQSEEMIESKNRDILLRRSASLIQTFWRQQYRAKVLHRQASLFGPTANNSLANTINETHLPLLFNHLAKQPIPPIYHTIRHYSSHLSKILQDGQIFSKSTGQFKGIGTEIDRLRFDERLVFTTVSQRFSLDIDYVSLSIVNLFELNPGNTLYFKFSDWYTSGISCATICPGINIQLNHGLPNTKCQFVNSITNNLIYELEIPGEECVYHGYKGLNRYLTFFIFKILERLSVKFASLKNQIYSHFIKFDNKLLITHLQNIMKQLLPYAEWDYVNSLKINFESITAIDKNSNHYDLEKIRKKIIENDCEYIRRKFSGPLKNIFRESPLLAQGMLDYAIQLKADEIVIFINQELINSKSLPIFNDETEKKKSRIDSVIIAYLKETSEQKFVTNFLLPRSTNFPSHFDYRIREKNKEHINFFLKSDSPLYKIERKHKLKDKAIRYLPELVLDTDNDQIKKILTDKEFDFSLKP